MPPQKPSNADVIAAINELSLTFGAELAAARAEVVALTAEVTALKELVKVKPYPSPDGGPIAAVLTTLPMPPELANMHPLSKYEVDLIQADKKIDAIKAYRARIQGFGGYVGLKEGKDLVCYVADNMTKSKPVFDEKNPIPMTPGQKDLVAQGKKIEAIKDYRTYVGTVCAGMCGLKEAKGVIDAYAAQYAAPLTLLPKEAAYLHYVAGHGVEGRFEAVKAYRFRTYATLEVAMKVVDAYIASKTDWITSTNYSG